VFALRVYFLAMFSALGAIVPLLALLLSDKGLTGAEVGWVMAILPSARMFAPPLWGFLADRASSATRLLAINSLICAFAMVALGLADGLLGVASAYFVWGACASSLIPLVEAHTYEVLGERSARFAHVRVFGSVGFAIVALALGALHAREAFASPLPFYVAAVCYAAASVAASRLTTRPVVARPPAFAVGELLARMGRRKRAAMASLWVASALYYAAHGVFDAYFGPLTKHALGLSASLVSQAWGIGVLAEIVVLLLAPRYIHRGDSRWLLPLAAGVASLRWLLLSCATRAIHILLLAPLHAVSFGLWYLAFVHENQRGAPASLRATVQGVAAACVGIGMVAATVLGGYGLERYGARQIFQTAAWIALFSALMYAARSVWMADEPSATANETPTAQD